MKSFLYSVSEFLDAMVARYPVVVAALAATLLATTMTTLGPLDGYSRALDDLLMRRAPVSLPDSQVLIVEMSPERVSALTNVAHSGNQNAVLDLVVAVRRLRELGGRQMAIGLLPRSASALIEDALTHDDVLFGRRYARAAGTGADSRADQVLEALPDEYRPLSNRIGMLAIPELQFGVSREKSLFAQVGNEILPALESLLASRSGGKVIPFGRGPLRIDFRGDAHRLPTLDFERVVSGDLLATLVEGRSILIGEGSNPFEPGIATPRSQDEDLLSAIEFRGYVVDTLLRDSGISRSRLLSIFLIASVALLGAALGQALSFGAAIFISNLASLAYAFAAWLSLGLLQFHLPAVELITAQPLACCFVVASHHIVERRELRRAARRTSALLHSLPEFPLRSPESHSTWHRLARFLKMTVGVERLLFLETSHTGESAREVHAVGCEMNQSRCHDLTAPPFAETIRTNSVQELTENLFESSSPRSVQFLLPLSAGGKTLGFCAVETAEFGPEYEASTLRALREIAPLSGRLVAEWEQMPTGTAFLSSDRNNRWERSATSDGARRLETNAKSLYQRIGTLQEIIEDGSVASAVFDLSGCALQSNSRLQTIASEYSLAIAGTDASEFISQLTGFEREQTRTMVRLVLLEDRKHVMPIRPLSGGHTRTLHLSPLKRPATEIEAPSQPFPLQGILIEVIDDEVAHQFHRHRARVLPIAERANLEISRLAASLDKLSRDAEIDTSALAGLARSAGEAVAALREDLANPLQPGDRDPALIEVSRPLECATEPHSAECARRSISIVFERPERPAFVKAPVASFQDLLEACVSLLVRDAMDSSTLILQIVEGPDRIEYALRNQGYGMPSNILRKGLSEIDDGSLADLTRIRRALPDAESVGADFTISSEVGEGIAIELIMPRAL